MHQAGGLQRLFSGEAMRVASVLAGPSAPPSQGFALALAAAWAKTERRVWLAAAGAGELAQALGYLPLRPWRASLPLAPQVIQAGAYGVIHAPGALAGEAALTDAAAQSRACDCLLFAGRRFSASEAPLVPSAAQTLIVLLGKRDAEAGYALVKGLAVSHSPAHVLLLGAVAERVAQAARQFLNLELAGRHMAAEVCQIGNRPAGTSSNTLSFDSNLTWVVSRIMQNDQPKVGYGGGSKRAEEVYE